MSVDVLPAAPARTVTRRYLICLRIFITIIELTKTLKYVNCVPFLPLDIIIQSKDAEKCKEHAGPAHEVPNVVTVKEVQQDAFPVHVPRF